MNSRAAGRASVIGTMIVSLGAITIAINYPSVSTASPYYQAPAPVAAPPPPPPRVVTAPPTIPTVPPIPTSIDVTFPPGLNHDYALNPLNTQTPQFNTSMSDGLLALSNTDFPAVNSLNSTPNDLIFVISPDAKTQPMGPSCVELEDGNVFGSVRNTGKTAMIKTPHGDVAVFASADVLVHTDHTHSTTVRIINLTGGNNKVRVRLNKDIVGEHETSVFSLAPGFELVCCEHKLSRDQLRPNDGYSRRRVQVMGGLHNIALTEVSAESVLGTSSLIAQMSAENNEKDRRVLKDLSKMAAVLNSVNGTQGYQKD